MANKNRNLIVAYFDTAAEADAAATKLKLWDKDRKDIKLGGMGIITMKDGKLHTEKVGAYATGTGAKWGTILGAAGGLAAGLLTGGIGLIPGAIAGLGLGTMGGMITHKRVGLTDDDRAKMEAHFAKGGAALAVMADDFEVEPTRAEIAALGGDMTSFILGDEVLAEVEEAQATIEAAEATVEKELSNLSDEQKADAAEIVAASRAAEIVGISGLVAAGVDDVEELAEKVKTAEGRAELATAVGANRAAVSDIAYDIDLGRVKGIGRKARALLAAAGINSVGEMAEYTPAELSAMLTAANEDEHIVERMPSEETLTYWIDQARELPGYLVAIKVIKDQLNADEYSWHAREGDDPKKTRFDAVMFNRKEGYEVVLMIQKICTHFGFTSVEDVKRVESVIANELPGNVRSQKNVYAWLVNYFETH